MTHVGKILVLVIMAFSLVFLGISTVVFVTSKNWRDETRKKTEEVQKVKKQLDTLQALADAAKQDLTTAQQNAAQEKQRLEGHLKTLVDQNKRDVDQITAVRGDLAKAVQTAETALADVQARRQETDLLRAQKSAVEKQANEFKLRQAELNDRIRELERMNETGNKNNADLRERVASYSALLRRNGLSDDISQIKGLASPPPVEGEVKRVDPTGRRLELTIGSDDGLVQGHELFVFRTKPRAEYLGRVQVVAVDPDQAVGKVVGNTFQGKKIKEGDIVSSTIRPRF